MSARSKKRLWVVVAALVLGLLLAEGFLRAALYAPWPWLRHRVGTLRECWQYADPTSSTHFALEQLVHGQPGPVPAHLFHPRLGWVSSEIVPATLRHLREGELGERRPLLLFGDSFARGMGPPEEHLEILFEARPRAAQFQMLNLGVRGYGLDQVTRLVELAAPRWRGREALALVMLNYEDTLERARVDFRGWPKPRPEFVDGRLTWPETPLPTVDEYLEAHSPVVWSYFFAWLCHGSRLIEDHARVRPIAPDVDRLVEPLLAGLKAAFDAAEIPFALVLFSTGNELTLARLENPRAQRLRSAAAAAGIPCRMGQREFALDHLATKRAASDYFGERGPMRDHLLLTGQAVALGTLERALEGLISKSDCDCHPIDVLFELAPDVPKPPVYLSRPGAPPGSLPEEEDWLVARVARAAPVDLDWHPQRSCARLSSRVFLAPTPAAQADAYVGVILRGDGRELFKDAVAVDRPLYLDVPVGEVEHVSLELCTGSGAELAVVFGSLRFGSAR